MGSKKTIYDKNGRKIGTVEEHTTEDFVKGVETLANIISWLTSPKTSYTSSKPDSIKDYLLLTLVVIIVVIVISTVASTASYFSPRNSYERVGNEVYAISVQGLSVLNKALSNRTVDTEMRQYFTDDAINQITEQIKSLDEQGQMVDLRVTIEGLYHAHLLDGGLREREDVSALTYGCISLTAQGTVEVRTSDGIIIKPQDPIRSLRFTFKKIDDQWRIMAVWPVGLHFNTFGDLHTYC